jgi:hypothetical protein
VGEADVAREFERSGECSRVKSLRLATVRKALEVDRAGLERGRDRGLGRGVRAVEPRIALGAVEIEGDQVGVPAGPFPSTFPTFVPSLSWQKDRFSIKRRKKHTFLYVRKVSCGPEGSALLRFAAVCTTSR